MTDGYKGGWDRATYSTAKGGLHALIKSLAAGLGEYGITVNDINHVDGAMGMLGEAHPAVALE